VQARTRRISAYLRLRQLLVLPLDEPLTLTTALPVAAGASDEALARASEEPQAAARGERGARGGVRRDSVARTVTGRGDTVRVAAVSVDPAEVLGDDPSVAGAVDSVVAAVDTSARGRATARQSRENVAAQRNLLRVARGQRLPAVQLSSNYQRFAYPAGDGITFPSAINQFFPNWTVTLGVSVPILTGGRIQGDILVAEANLREAQATARQVEELSALDAQLAVTQLLEAEASFQASAGTAEQAARAFGIAEVRFREGLSTQVDLADARILLQQAQANAAQAARDREVARLRPAPAARPAAPEPAGRRAGRRRRPRRPRRRRGRAAERARRRHGAAQSAGNCRRPVHRPARCRRRAGRRLRRRPARRHRGDSVTTSRFSSPSACPRIHSRRGAAAWRPPRSSSAPLARRRPAAATAPTRPRTARGPPRSSPCPSAPRTSPSCGATPCRAAPP
jgi:hypothetical protein